MSMPATLPPRLSSASAPSSVAPAAHGWAARLARVARAWPLVLVVGVGLVFATLLFFHRPQGQFFFPRCTFHTVTGLWCPGCGGLRATHALLHGHGFEAIRYNALYVLGVPAALAYAAWRRRTGRTVELTGAQWCLVVAVILLFTVLRNVPWPPFVWLAPPAGT